MVGHRPQGFSHGPPPPHWSEWGYCCSAHPDGRCMEWEPTSSRLGFLGFCRELFLCNVCSKTTDQTQKFTLFAINCLFLHRCLREEPLKWMGDFCMFPLLFCNGKTRGEKGPSLCSADGLRLGVFLDSLPLSGWMQPRREQPQDAHGVAPLGDATEQSRCFVITWGCDSPLGAIPLQVTPSTP